MVLERISIMEIDIDGLSDLGINEIINLIKENKIFDLQDFNQNKEYQKFINKHFSYILTNQEINLIFKELLNVKKDKIALEDIFVTGSITNSADYFAQNLKDSEDEHAPYMLPVTTPSLGNAPSLSDGVKLKYVNVFTFADEVKQVIYDEMQSLTSAVSENPIVENNTMIPLCKYLTFEDDSISIISKNYPYANVQKNLGICSHPSMLNDLKPKYCFYITEQNSCTIYNYDIEVLKVDSVSYGPYIPETKIALTYVENVNISKMEFKHHFEIIDIENNSLIQKISFDNIEQDYDVALQNAVEIYNEYLKEYQSNESLQKEIFSISHVKDQNNFKPSNYFDHILELVK